MKRTAFLNNIGCYIAAAAAVFAAFEATAQNSDLDRNVVVERDYQAASITAEKISQVPPEDSGLAQPDSVKVKYNTACSPTEIWPATGKASDNGSMPTTKDVAKNGIFKAGLGFYWQVFGDFYYPLLKGDQFLLDINLKHRSNWGRVTLADGTKPRAMDHITQGELNFESQFDACRLVADIDFSTGGFDYYGLSTVPAETNLMKDTIGTFTTVGADFELYSTDSKASFQYDADLGYHFITRNFGLMQHEVNVAADMFGEAGSGYFGGIVAVDMHFYAVDAALNQGNFAHNAKIKLTPYYKWMGDNWDFTLGANLFVFAKKGAALPVTASADIRGNFALVPDRLLLYAGITGDFKDNNYFSILQENHFIRPDLNVDPTYTPLAVDFGLKVNIMRGLLFDLNFNYDLILDQYYFVNDTAGDLFYNTFSTVKEQNTHKVAVEAGLYYDGIKGLDIKLVGRYNYWKTTENLYAWHKPTWEVEFDASYRFLDKWKVGLGYNFQGGRHALVCGEAVSMRDVHDLNVSLSYDALKWLTVFAEGRNLANVKADTYYGYTTFGINGLIGVSMYF